VGLITEAPAVRQILVHLGEPTSPPRLAPARGPPLWEMPDAGKDRFDPQAQPAPDLRIRSAHRLVGATTRRGPVARHGAARAWGHQADPLRLLA